MTGSSFGNAFRVTTAGESHGPGQVVIVDGCPPGLPLSEVDLQKDLNRRRPGQSALVTQRKESDTAEILSGVFDGETTGTPIAILIRNEDQRSRDYANIKDTYRPGHADFTYDAKYGRRDYRGGGRASARESASRVAAGAVAKKFLYHAANTLTVVGWTRQVGEIVANIHDPTQITESKVEYFEDGSVNPTRCPDHTTALQMIEEIDHARKSLDSLGGVAEVCAQPMPAGLGEPVFDKLKADLAKALLSLPAVVGFEYGAGFELASMRGSQANDLIKADEHGCPVTTTNRHGGILGGISSGMPLTLRAALKPTSSLPQPQPSINREGDAIEVKTTGRHDPCLLPRFIPMAEAMVALVLADHWIRQLSNQTFRT